jgi:hypothetical protein
VSGAGARAASAGRIATTVSLPACATFAIAGMAGCGSRAAVTRETLNVMDSVAAIESAAVRPCSVARAT